MSLKEKFSVQCLTSSDFSPTEEITVEWNVAGNFKYLAHKSYIIHEKNKRQGTHSTKTRSEVRGGGKKPWKQKGTGRARAGSNRSPLWRGGGVIFGPTPRTINLKLNKKEKALTFNTLVHLNKENLVVLDNFACFSNVTKTKDFISILKSIETKVLSNNVSSNYLVLADTNENYELLKRVTKNISNVHLVQQENLNIPLLLKADQKVILTKSFFEKFK